ncbi:MAG: hypothetical protein C0609_06580 [Deltaproteobacteria bacterium]|nr:MAG: hypothetical protein C0609_06580 [Deltaproteobacteria bacterium]
MKKRRIIFHLLALTAVVAAVGRPDRLFSTPVPVFDDAASEKLSLLSEPIALPAGEAFTQKLNEESRELLGLVYTEGELKSHETLDSLLRKEGVENTAIFNFARALTPVLDPRTMRPGDRYGILTDPEGSLLSFEYSRSPVEKYRADLSAEGWKCEEVEVEVTHERARTDGILAGSLWESFTRTGADADLIMAFVELFGWDIDFAHESQPGDEFRVIYEKLYADGVFVGNGRIIAASYKDSEETHYAFYYAAEKSKGYYDIDGNNVRKSFLRSPLKFSRISSKFSYNRKHPVTKKVQPHMGVDYAASVGTPVWAVADGTVTFAGRKGPNGKMITLRHARGYETFYLHLSRFAKGIKTGRKVDQGQTIGYVGSTGRATGPHLDYRLKQNGKWVNPLRHKYKPGPPVDKENKDGFNAVAKTLLAELEDVKLPAQLAEAVK